LNVYLSRLIVWFPPCHFFNFFFFCAWDTHHAFTLCTANWIRLIDIPVASCQAFCTYPSARIVRLRLSYVSSIASIYRRIKSGVGRVNRFGRWKIYRVARCSQEDDPFLVRGCVLQRAKITSSLSADINLFGRGIRDQVDLAYFVQFGGFCFPSPLPPPPPPPRPLLAYTYT
jgi:hypothetical protein